jgi:hypothetical protein
MLDWHRRFTRHASTTMRTMASKLPTLLAAGVLSATLTGCVDNNSSIFILGVGFFNPDNGCACEPDEEAPLLAQGTVDSAQRGAGYTACLRVGNQMIESNDDNRLRVETSRVTLFEAEVEVFDFQSNSLTSFSQPISGFIDAGGGSTPSFGAAIITMIDQGTLGAIDTAGGGQTVVSRIRLFGESLGGNDVETGLYDFPITVCNGCLGCVEAAECDDKVASVCQLGQDAVADCRCIPGADGNNISGTCPGPVQSCFPTSD